MSSSNTIDPLFLVILFQALTVFILYVRCTRINPADAGIMSKFDDDFINIPKNNPGMPGIDFPDNHYNNASGSHSSPSSACRSSLDGNPNKKASPGGDVRINTPVDLPKKSKFRCCRYGGFVCALFVKEDCRKPETTEHEASVEDALFCTLCNAEVKVVDDMNLIDGRSLMVNHQFHSFLCFSNTCEMSLYVKLNLSFQTSLILSLYYILVISGDGRYLKIILIFLLSLLFITIIWNLS